MFADLFGDGDEDLVDMVIVEAAFLFVFVLDCFFVDVFVAFRGDFF